MAIKPNSLSSNIVGVMQSLAKNQGLAMLLLNDVSRPFEQALPSDWNNLIINQGSNSCRIHPYPFDPEAQVEDASFIRVYYNQGEFNDNETIQEMNLHIDIIVAKSLWLIQQKDLKSNLYVPQIRPYEIMDRVVDIVGRKSINSTIRLKFDGWQHLAVNSKFDAIRLYSDYFNVETNYHTYDK